VLRKVWGCEGVTTSGKHVHTEIDGDTEYRYFNCPTKFIGRSIREFIDLKNTLELFEGAKLPNIDDISVRYITALKYYNAKCAEYSAENDGR